MNAIIVEDDQIIGRFIACVLESEGMDSVVYGCGEDVVIPEDANIAVIDLVLPGISGLRVAGMIRDRSHDITIVFITGTTDPFNVRLMLGYTNYIIAKPFTESRIDDLRRVVQAIKSECH